MILVHNLTQVRFDIDNGNHLAAIRHCFGLQAFYLATGEYAVRDNQHTLKKILIRMRAIIRTFTDTYYPDRQYKNTKSCPYFFRMRYIFPPSVTVYNDPCT